MIFAAPEILHHIPYSPAISDCFSLGENLMSNMQNAKITHFLTVLRCAPLFTGNKISSFWLWSGDSN